MRDGIAILRILQPRGDTRAMRYSRRAVRLVISGLALALGTLLVLSGVADLILILSKPEQRLGLAVLGVAVVLPWILGAGLLVVGGSAWRRTRSS